MTVIVDCGNQLYYQARAIEEIKTYGATDLAIKLLVLALAEKENETVQS